MLISQPRPSLVTKSRKSACAPCVSTVIKPGKAHAPLALLSKAESWNQSLVTVGCAFPPPSHPLSLLDPILQHLVFRPHFSVRSRSSVVPHSSRLPKLESACLVLIPSHSHEYFGRYPLRSLLTFDCYVFL